MHCYCINPLQRLSYKEQCELDDLPGKIENLESQLATLEAQISDSSFYAQQLEMTKPVLDAFSDTQASLELALERWTSLEDQLRIYRESRS